MAGWEIAKCPEKKTRKSLSWLKANCFIFFVQRALRASETLTIVRHIFDDTAKIAVEQKEAEAALKKGEK